MLKGLMHLFLVLWFVLPTVGDIMFVSDWAVKNGSV